MTVLLRTQRDSMRQPGVAQRAAAWRAYAGAVQLGETTISSARDSRTVTSAGAAAAMGELTP
jgi:hypothetical protein